MQFFKFVEFKNIVTIFISFFFKLDDRYCYWFLDDFENFGANENLKSCAF